MTWRACLLAITLLFGSACSARGEVEAQTTDEPAERKAIFDAVEKAFEARDYAALNRMAEEYRTNRARTPSGTWKLAMFYYAVEPYALDQNGATCRPAREDVLADWAATDPEAPASYIAKAAALTSYGACLRGRAYARSTSSDAMNAMREQMAEARAVLETHRDAASVDPQFYAVSIDMMKYDTRQDDDFEDLVDEATGREPYYHETYFAAARYLDPKWHGSPGAIERFAKHAEDEGDGEGMHARILWSLAGCDCGYEQLKDWPAMKTSMDVVLERFPNDWNAAHFAAAACGFGDVYAAEAFLGKVGKDDASLWESHDAWQHCRAMVEQLKTSRSAEAA